MTELDPDAAITHAVGDELQRLRYNHRWSRPEFVQRLGAGWKVNTYACYEQGVRPCPLPRLVEICRALEDEPWDVLRRALSPSMPSIEQLIEHSSVGAHVWTDADAAEFVRALDKLGYSVWRSADQ